MVQAAIESLLTKKIGLEPNSIGSQRIGKAAEIRRVACGLPDMQSYLKQLQSAPQELEELIEELVVPETWFFRDGKPFEFLVNYVKSELLPKRNNSIIRLLSAPCSTGEEPYSIAISLMNAGLVPQQFRIDAVDISKRSLLKAQKGIYGKNSFRGGGIPQKEFHFQETPAGWQISDRVRQTVNFIQGNLLDPYFGAGKSYDVIFCRNLLIYLSESAYSQVVEVLDRLLLPNGLLFVGASETGKTKSDRLVSVRQPFTFAYRKLEEADRDRSLSRPLKNSLKSPEFESAKTAKQAETKSEKQPVKFIQEVFPSQENLGTLTKEILPTIPNAKRPLTESQITIIPSQEIKINSGALQIPNTETPAAIPNLQTARNLADAGDLDRSANITKNYLRSHPTSYQAYLLLGEVYQAGGDEKQAEECFQKAIYLDPNCYEALTHLALIKKNRGDFKNAAAIEQRIQRLQNKESNS